MKRIYSIGEFISDDRFAGQTLRFPREETVAEPPSILPAIANTVSASYASQHAGLFRGLPFGDVLLDEVVYVKTHFLLQLGVGGDGRRYAQGERSFERSSIADFRRKDSSRGFENADYFF